MKFDPKIHHRHSIRLPGYDYTQAGGYFVTIVTQARELLFGEVADGEMHLNTWGHVVDECWRAIPDHFPNVELGNDVIMPNHLHGIILIHEHGRGAIYRAPAEHGPATIERAPTPTTEQFGKPVAGSLPTIVRTFKAAVTRRLGREFNAVNIWQKNYYEHIIRDTADHERIYRYIEANPSAWDDDDENPSRRTA